MASSRVRHLEQQIADLQAELAIAKQQHDDDGRVEAQPAQMTNLVGAKADLEAAQDDEEPFRFLDFPPELRDMVYQECLATGFYSKQWKDPPSHDIRFRHLLTPNALQPKRPEVQLFAVSKQVAAEAVRILLENVTIYATHTDDNDFYPSKAIRLSNSAAVRAIPRAKVSVAFDCRALDLNEHYGYDLSWIHNDWMIKKYATRREHRREMHVLAVTALFENHWDNVIHELHHTPISYLEINMQNCMCPCLCVSLYNDVMSRLARYYESQRDNAPTKIRILGIVNARSCRDAKDEFLEELPEYVAPPEITFAAIADSASKDEEYTEWTSLDADVDVSQEADDEEGVGKNAEEEAEAGRDTDDSFNTVFDEAGSADGEAAGGEEELIDNDEEVPDLGADTAVGDDKMDEVA